MAIKNADEAWQRVHVDSWRGERWVWLWSPILKMPALSHTTALWATAAEFKFWQLAAMPDPPRTWRQT